jgi:hypothetical protein
LEGAVRIILVRLITTYLLLFLASTALLAQADEEQVSRHNKSTAPAPGETKTVTVGETIFQEIDQTEYLWAELRSDLRASGKVVLGKGSRLWGATREDKVREFCDVDLPGRACFWDDDGNGTFDRAKVIGSSRLTGIAGSYRELWEPGDDQTQGQRWELVYMGAGGGVLRFSARQYAGRDTRPLSQSEVTFDLNPSGPTLAVYRGIRIEVSALNNEGITYKVLSLTDGKVP